jgi:hypothetical protein
MTVQARLGGAIATTLSVVTVARASRGRIHFLALGGLR